MKKYYTLLCTLLCFCFMNIVFACTSSHMVTQVPLFFFEHSLGVYDVNLEPTLAAIADGSADNGRKPYYGKMWEGSCPSLMVGQCHEYTVYPNDQNFQPAGIMGQIKQYTNGEENRGEVRVITNADETQYVYTTDHEKTFCGPYHIS